MKPLFEPPLRFICCFDLRHLLVILLSLPLLAFAAPALKPLAAGDFEALKAAHQGRPLVVALWGTDCTHCRPDLARLAAFARKHPTARLLVINTDSPADETLIRQVLAASGIPRGEFRYFADEPPERLRWEIDRKWSGELPRHYLVDAGGQVHASSGPLAPEDLAAWAKRNGVAGK